MGRSNRVRFPCPGIKSSNESDAPRWRTNRRYCDLPRLRRGGAVRRERTRVNRAAGDQLDHQRLPQGLHQTFEVVGSTAGSRANEVIYIVRRKHAKQDRLLELCVPLKGT